MTLPPVKGMSPSKLLPREARRIMGSAANFHYLFWSPLKKAGLEQQYYFLAAPKGEMVSFLQALSMSGLKAKKVDSRALALTRGVGVATAMILNLETSGVDMIAVVDYVPLVVSHRDLQVGLGTDDLMEEVIDEFRSSTEQFSDRNPGAASAQNLPVYLTGAHPYINASFAQTLENSLNRELFYPDPSMEYPEDFPAVQYMVNVGLALKSR